MKVKEIINSVIWSNITNLLKDKDLDINKKVYSNKNKSKDREINKK